MDNRLKEGLIWTGATLVLGFLAYRRCGERPDDWIGPIALTLAAFTASQSANCFAAATQDYWQLREVSQDPQLSQGQYIRRLSPLASNS